MKIEADHHKLQYSGRIDFTDPKAPVFIYPCTFVRMRFTGNTLKAYVTNRRAYLDNYMGCILDGAQTAYRLPNEGEAEFEILAQKDAAAQVHEVMLFKRQDACHEITFCGFVLADDGAVLELEDLPARKIEVYGDSVSAGEVSEALAYVGKEDPLHQGEYSNSWYSYAWMTARRLHAQLHDIAQGGIALMDHTGWFNDERLIGMEQVWDKLHYNPQLGGTDAWDFSRYIPQVVIVAIGQNDSHPQDYMKEDAACKKAEVWRAHYKAFLGKIRMQYPDAHIICCTTLLCHDASWDHSIERVCRELNDEKITHYMFRRNGTGTPGHLRIPEAEEMAEELATYMEGLSVWKQEKK
ncbi:MAG: electron transporter RnfD [Eubacterium sp.]|nr:electron transporter RnfD [Eubacterium sp.]